MEILEILFFLSSLFPIIQASIGNTCPTSFCGNISLNYPFKLQNIQPQNNCTYINLTCQETVIPVLTLPYSGDFYVRDIEYYDPYDPYIELYDPEKCLMRRLMKKLNLSSSPFKAITYENYTFYMCPSNASPIGQAVMPIHCLSNSTNSTIATSLDSTGSMLDYGCKIIGSWLLPVSEPYQFELNGVNGEYFYLTWNSTRCEACEEGDPPVVVDSGGSKDNSWTKFAGSPYFIPSCVTIVTFLFICTLQVIKFIASRYETNSDFPRADALPESAAAVTAPPQSTAGGLDEAKINSCTELVVFSDSRSNPGDDSNTCSICLDIYLPPALVRSIAKCEHRFHAECIEMWLKKNRTCPVCRTNVVEL